MYFGELLENVESLKIRSYPGVRHMAVQEAGEEPCRDVRAFLDGKFEVEVKESVDEEA